MPYFSTAADDLLLCGDVPSSIEEALLESVEDCDVRDSVTLFFGPMRPCESRSFVLDTGRATTDPIRCTQILVRRRSAFEFAPPADFYASRRSCCAARSRVLRSSHGQ